MKLDEESKQVVIEDVEVPAVRWALLRDLRARLGAVHLDGAEGTVFSFSEISLLALRSAVLDAIRAIEADVVAAADVEPDKDPSSCP